MGIFSNVWLWIGIVSSMILHFIILYIPFFNILFNTVSLDLNDWILVLSFSLPVIFLDEILKFLSRMNQSNKVIDNKKLK